MLVLAAQHTDQETVVRERAAEIFERVQVRSADGVASQTQDRIRLQAYANHKRNRKVEFAARRQDGFRQQMVAQSFGRIEESVRKGDGHVHGPHPLVPIEEETLDLGCGFSRSLRVDLIALCGQHLPIRGPILENPIEPERGAKLRVLVRAIQPGRSFFGIQRVVGHYHDADSSHVEHAPDVGIEGLRLEKGTRFS